MNKNRTAFSISLAILIRGETGAPARPADFAAGLAGRPQVPARGQRHSTAQPAPEQLEFHSVSIPVDGSPCGGQVDERDW